jgi:hypothetical protein
LSATLHKLACWNDPGILPTCFKTPTVVLSEVCRHCRNGALWSRRFLSTGG